MTRETIPQTDSIQELAEFWETHDLTEFENQLEEVEELVFDRESIATPNSNNFNSAKSEVAKPDWI
ncbi:hypothetical protein POG22_03090 [Geitlerinema sp. CS-897]|nr:hypothetical protein [Geitlerinema sp. CS-897]